MQFNTLADCLAKSAPVLGPRRGFRCRPEALKWEHRKPLLQRELLRYSCDIIGACEVDRYEDLEPALARAGYLGAFRRKRSPAKDGVAVFWRGGGGGLEEALRRGVFLGPPRSPGAQVALLQRLRLPPEAAPTTASALAPAPGQQRGGEEGAAEATGGRPGSRSIVVCATHFRASADDAFRMQQAAEVVTALSDFSRGDEQILLADVNSAAPRNGEMGGAATTVFEYLHACGYRCAYRSIGQHLHGKKTSSVPLDGFPRYTTWAGWATGDFRGVCDHIFVSSGIYVAGVLDVPTDEPFATAFPERLPNDEFPSDHMSLVADLILC